MKIKRSPYHANVNPHKGTDEFLWYCIVRREGSAEVVARHNAATKEDACAAALLTLARLHPMGNADSGRTTNN